MPWYEFIWDDLNTAKLALNYISMDEAEYVVRAAVRLSKSASSGRPIVFGRTQDGRLLAVIFEEIDAVTAYVVTAYDLE